ncbi:hypothetical protein BG015_002170 [Linnemannia schmuckeri]|uniref:Uncharacterized protein n=1 Tax=Linnemannia schmuckeri TaxID=64567 RepID=A0A9P5RP39_9FUNG|nr:hypothetical protein BG015_002170 [Linnemannia schmuckeri]
MATTSETTPINNSSDSIVQHQHQHQQQQQQQQQQEQHVPPSSTGTPSTPKFKVFQETFMFMNQQPVHIQVIEMDNSQWVWISSAGANPLQQQQQDALQGGSGAGGGGGAGAGGAGTGAFGDLAMAMPVFRAGQTPVSSTLLGSPIDETAASIARRLATKFKRQFLVNLDIPASVDNAMVLAYSERKLVDMLRVIADTTAAGDV